MFLQKIAKSINNGFRRLPETAVNAYRTYSQAKTAVQKFQPQIEDAVNKGKNLYEQVVKPNISNETAGKIENNAQKAYNYGNSTVDKIRKADAVVQNTSRILGA
jgi:hypothetical protein